MNECTVHGYSIIIFILKSDYSLCVDLVLRYEAGACALKQSITTSRGLLYPLGITPILLILLPRDIKKGYATGFRQLKEECLHSLKKELKQGQVKEK